MPLPLPTDRTIANTRFEHVSDHNTIHDVVNEALTKTTNTTDAISITSSLGFFLFSNDSIDLNSTQNVRIAGDTEVLIETTPGNTIFIASGVTQKLAFFNGAGVVQPNGVTADDALEALGLAANVVAPSVTMADYTPTLTQSGAVTKTVTSARWSQQGKLVHVWVRLTVTGTGTAANPVLIGLPIACVQIGTIGAGFLFDTSANLKYNAVIDQASSTTVAMAPTNSTVNGSLGTEQFIAALANGDIIDFFASYETT